MFIQRRKITAADDIQPAETKIAPEATDLLFEAEDVAELVAEVTGQPVEVTADEDNVTFAVGEDEYTVQSEGDEEILQSVRRPFAGRKRVAASTNRRIRRANSGKRAVRSIKLPRK